MRTRRLTALGLVCAGILTIGAAVASTASATDHEFTLESSPATLTANEEPGLINMYGAALTECSAIRFHGTVEEIQGESLAVTPSFEECLFASDPVPVRMNGCYYLLTGVTAEASEEEAAHGLVHLKCPEGKVVDIDVGILPCTHTIAEQTAKGGVTYTQMGSGSTANLLVDFTISFTMNVHGPFLPCANLYDTSFFYSGSVELSAETEDGEEHIGIKLS